MTPTLPPRQLASAAARTRSGWWRWAVGLGLLALLAAAIGWRELEAVLLVASPRWLALLAVVSLLWLVLGACNVWLLLRKLEPVRFVAFLQVYLESWLLSLVLPGQLGDASQVLLLRRTGVPARKSGAAYLVDKLVSVLWLGAVSTVGVALYTPYRAALWLLSLSAVCVLALVLVRLVGRAQGPTQGWTWRVRKLWDSTLDQIHIFRHHPGSIALNLGLTMIKWALSTVLYIAAFRAVRTAIGLGPAATIPFISSLVGYIPVTVAGAGTMEMTAMALFGRLGVPSASVLAAYLLLRAAIILVALLGWAALRSPVLARGRP